MEGDETSLSIDGIESGGEVRIAHNRLRVSFDQCVI